MKSISPYSERLTLIKCHTDANCLNYPSVILSQLQDIHTYSNCLDYPGAMLSKIQIVCTTPIHTVTVPYLRYPDCLHYFKDPHCLHNPGEICVDIMLVYINKVIYCQNIQIVYTTQVTQQAVMHQIM